MSGLSTTMEGKGGRLLKGPIRPDNCHQELRTAPSAQMGKIPGKGSAEPKQILMAAVMQATVSPTARPGRDLHMLASPCFCSTPGSVWWNFCISKSSQGVLEHVYTPHWECVSYLFTMFSTVLAGLRYGNNSVPGLSSLPPSSLQKKSRASDSPILPRMVPLTLLPLSWMFI